MKKLSAINFNRNVKNGTIIALALAVVIGMSYFGSQDYLNQAIMDMLMGATNEPTCSNGTASCGGYCCPGKEEEGECYCEVPDVQDLDECECSAGDDCIDCPAFCPTEHHRYDWCTGGGGEGGRDGFINECPGNE